MYIKLLIVSILISFCQCATDEQYTLQRVFLFFRHGIRAPLHRYKFDPFYDDSFWPNGGSQLTKRGQGEVYDVGKKLRKRYADFIEPHSQILAHDIKVVSTEVDRVLQTAGILLSSFYPPNEDQVFTDELNWLPVPTYTNSPDKSYLITVFSGCDRYYEERDKDTEELNDDELFKKVYEYVKEYDTEGEMTMPTDLLTFIDSINSAGRMNYELPDWVKKVYPKPFWTIENKIYLALIGSRSTKRLFSGSLVKDLIAQMNDTIDVDDDDDGYVDTDPESKFYLYAGHDTSIYGILDLFGFELDSKPDFASTLLFELYKNQSNKYFVKIIYSQSIEFEQQELEIPGCDSIFCPYEKFVKIAKPYLPDDWEAECASTSDINVKDEL